VKISSDTFDRFGVLPSRVLHVGAHEAEEADVYARWGAEVLWVEANPTLANRLKERGLNVVCRAAWSSAGPLTLHVASNGHSSSVYPMGLHTIRHPDVHTVGTVQTEGFRLDSLPFLPDMLNLDIQGAELEALKGAVGLLGGVRWICTEVSSEELYVGQSLVPELDRWLGERGFVQVAAEWTDRGWGDALYVRM
jgi:FkbM family methyltransferase